VKDLHENVSLFWSYLLPTLVALTSLL